MCVCYMFINININLCYIKFIQYIHIFLKKDMSSRTEKLDFLLLAMELKFMSVICPESMSPNIMVII